VESVNKELGYCHWVFCNAHLQIGYAGLRPVGVYLQQVARLAESTIKKMLIKFRVANIETMCDI
jgi:hypothetical protein